MRDLRVNSRDLWYATYLGVEEETDSNGDYTGEKKQLYSAPVWFRANLSATRGTQGFTGTGSSYDYFGADVKYDLIISTANMDLPIDEYSLIWDAEPERIPSSTGTSGISGVSGASGVSGISGISGTSGVSGASGASGESGEPQGEVDYSKAKYRVKAVARGLHHMKYAIQTLQRTEME